MTDRAFALIVWSDVLSQWCCLAVSLERTKVASLKDRLDAFVVGHFMVIETASMNDEDVERAGLAVRAAPLSFAEGMSRAEDNLIQLARERQRRESH